MQIDKYEQGMVKLSRQGIAWDDDGFSTTRTWIEDGKAYLPHSCDEWIIGGPEEVATLIADLQAILEQQRAK